MLTIEARLVFRDVVAAALFSAVNITVAGAAYANTSAAVQSPNGRNSISLAAAGGKEGELQVVVSRDKRTVINGTYIGPILTKAGLLAAGSHIVDVQQGTIDETFELPWGKTKTVADRCSTAVITLVAPLKIRWQMELRAYDDGVAFRYRVLEQ